MTLECCWWKVICIDLITFFLSKDLFFKTHFWKDCISWKTYRRLALHRSDTRFDRGIIFWRQIKALEAVSCLSIFFRHYMGRTRRICVFGYMQTAKAQISLCIRAVWSGSSLSPYKLNGYYRMYELRAKSRLRLCACAGWCESAHFAIARRHFVPLTWPVL